MKFKDFVNGLATKLAGTRSAEILGHGKVERDKYPFMVTWMYNPKIGLPRRVDTTILRDFGKTVWVAECVDTLVEEISSVRWDIVPKEGFEDKFDEKRKNEIVEFFKYPNKDEDYINFIKKLLADIYVLDSGVIVKVFGTDLYTEQKTWTYDSIFKKNDEGEYVSHPYSVTKHGWKTDPEVNKIIKQMMEDKNNQGLPILAMHVGDGASFLVQTDKTGRLYEDRPTFFQYSFLHPAGAPLPFFKREIVYFKMNPTSQNFYGWSPIQNMMNMLEALNNAIRFNKEFFSEYATPNGIITFEGMQPDDLKKIKESWKNEMKGRPHKVLFSSYPIDFKQLTQSATEMQWLEGQKFYQKHVMALYHVNQSEIGFSDEVNKHSSEIQSRVFVRKGVMPMLELLSGKFNNEIIPELYKDKPEVECEFKYFYLDTTEEQRKLKNDMMDLKMGVRTVNEIRNERGLDPVEWGDEPYRAGGLGGMGMGLPTAGMATMSIDEPELKKKLTIPTSGMTEETRDYLAFLKSYYANIERIVLAEFKKSRMGVEKSLNKNFSTFWNKVLSILNTIPNFEKLAKIVKSEFIKGISKAEEEIKIDIGFEEQFNPYIEQLTKEQIDGYVLPDGKRWFGIQGMNDDLVKQLHQEITEGLNERESHTQIAKRIKIRFDIFEDSRAMRIARTESTRLMNQGANTAYARSGVKGKKEWLSHVDARTSDVCKRLDGQKVDPHEAFTDPATGEQFWHPPAHPNCRSTIVFVPEEE